LSKNDQSPNNPGFEVIACIGGRGFGVRREDMKKMLLTTRGKVFIIQTLDKMIEYSMLKKFKAKRDFLENEGSGVTGYSGRALRGDTLPDRLARPGGSHQVPLTLVQVNSCFLKGKGCS
jgi:hypothetical protein